MVKMLNYKIKKGVKGLAVFLIIIHLYPFPKTNAKAQISVVDQEKRDLKRDWKNLRSALLNKGIDFNAIYTGEIFSNLQGGIKQGSEYLDIVDLMLTINLDDLVHWKNATFCIDIIGVNGGNPTNLVGDFQGVSNIAACNTWKIHETWVQKNLVNNRLSILMGIYDLNSEFDLIETAGLFINSSCGMGPEFSQSGKNGAPTFPYPDLALRIKTKLFEHLYIQAAILDGVPGDPENPEGTGCIIKKEDGALLTSEIAFIKVEEKLKYFPPTFKRKKRRCRRIGFCRHRKFHHKSIERKRHQCTPIVEIPNHNYSKIAIGWWYYTTDFNDLLDCDEAGNPIRHKGSWGIYALGEKVIFSKNNNPTENLSVFYRTGISDKKTNRIDTYLGGGVVYSGIFPKHSHDQIGFAVAAAHNSAKFKKARLKEGKIYDNWEVVLELSYRAQINNWCSIQPDVQYIVNPGYDPSLKNAVAIGARIEISL